MRAQLLRRSRPGFTLIELLIVVVIIGIIAAIAIPNLLGALDRTKYKRAIVDLRNISTSIGLYNSDRSYVPNTATYADLIALLKTYKPHVDELPEQDSWGNEFYYKKTGISEYTLTSFGKDGQSSNPAQTGVFDPDDDLIVINGVFAAIN